MPYICVMLRKGALRTMHAIMVPFPLIPAVVWENLLAPATAFVLDKHARVLGAILVDCTAFPAVQTRA